MRITWSQYTSDSVIFEIVLNFWIYWNKSAKLVFECLSVHTNASKVGVTCDILKHFQECISNLRNNIIVILFCCFTFSVWSRYQFLFLFIKWEKSINWINIFHDEYKTFSLDNGFDCLGWYSWNFWTKNNNRAMVLLFVWLENSWHLELSPFRPEIW